MRLNQRGMSLVTVIAGVAILGVTSAVTVGIMSRTVKNQSSSKLDMEVGPLVNRALSGLTSVMRDIGPGQNAGLCTMMSTPMRAGGVGRIVMTLLGEDSRALNANWDKAFPRADWTELNQVKRGVNCRPTAYSRCFQVAEGGGFNPDSLKKMDPIIRAQIVPVRSRAGGNAQFEKVDLKKKDGGPTVVSARDLSFLLRVSVNHLEGTGPDEVGVETSGFAVLWSGEMNCKYKHTRDPITGETPEVMMSPSGIGSGIAPQTVFSDTLEAASSSKDLFDVVWEKKNISRRRINPATGFLEVVDTPEAMKIAMCTEKVFRCRQKSTTPRSWFQAMNLKAYIAYNPNNDVYSGSMIKAAPRLCFHSEAAPSAKVCPKVEYTLSDKKADFDNPQVVYDSTRRGMVMLVGDADDLACPRACQDSVAPGIDHNHALENSPEVRRHLVTTHMYHRGIGVPGGHDEVDTPIPAEPVACQCCFTKHCRRQGIASGPCYEQPIEPMDSRVPECEGGQVSANSLRERLKFHTAPGWTSTDANPNSCLSARLRESMGSYRLELRSRPCSTTLPVLCYHMGSFNLARDLNRRAVTAKYEDAPQACYGLGHERIVDAAAFEGMLRSGQGAAYQGNPRPPVVAGNYEFVNNAIVGLFIAPETQEQMKSLFKITNPELASLPEFWVALKTDASGIIRARHPLGVPNRSPWTIFYEGPFTRFAKDEGMPVRDTAPRLMTQAERNATGSPPGTMYYTPKAMMLLHSRALFGAYPVDADQGDRRVPAVCYRPSGEMVFSSPVSRVSDVNCPPGSAFIPPSTPMQWIHALLKAGPTHAEHPWPRTLGAAWIALRPVSDTADGLNDSSWRYAIRYNYGSKGRIQRSGVNSDSSTPSVSVCYRYSEGWELEIRSGAKACSSGRYYLNRPTDLFTELLLAAVIAERGLGASTVYDLKGASD